MVSAEEMLAALRQRLLEAIESKTVTSDTILTLAEAHAWLVAPEQPHGGRAHGA